MKTLPYLLVEFSQRARDGVNTSVKGWMDDPKNLVTYERASVVDRLDSNAEVKSAIIINLVEGAVVKTTVPKPDDELVAHYVGKYEDMIRKSLQVWARREISAGIDARTE